MDDFELFIACEKGNAMKAAIEVASDPIIFAGIKNWDKLDQKQRIVFAERYTRLSGQALHAPLVAFKTFEEPMGKTGMYTQGLHTKDDFLGSVIKMNVHPDVLPLIGLADVLNTPPHEMAHEKQKQAISNPSSLPPQFASWVPERFKRNLANYIPAEKNLLAYRHQDLEEHAFAVGDTFSETAMDFVSKRGFLPNPYDEQIVRSEFEQCMRSRTAEIYLPAPNGIKTADPYRHYYSGMLAENRLGQPGSGHTNDRKWKDAIDHYRNALVCGEFLGYDPVPALEGLNRFATNQVWDDRGPQSRRIDVPTNIQTEARKYLEQFKDSQKDSIRLNSHRMLDRMNKQEKVKATATLNS